MPHAPRVPKHWNDIIEAAKKIDWTDENWLEASHKDIYSDTKKTFETPPRFTVTGEEICWKKLWGENKSLYKLATNEENIISYRVAVEGYIFGKKKRTMGFVTPDNITRYTCIYCCSLEDDIAHVIWECRVAKHVWKAIREFVNTTYKLNITIQKSELLYGNYQQPNIELKYITGSIFKKYVICSRITDEIVREAGGELEETEERLQGKILKELKKRWKIYTMKEIPTQQK